MTRHKDALKYPRGVIGWQSRWACWAAVSQGEIWERVTRVFRRALQAVSASLRLPAARRPPASSEAVK